MARDSKPPRPRPYKDAPQDAEALLDAELRRRGMSEGEIASALRKKKRRKPLEFAAVQSRRAMQASPARKGAGGPNEVAPSGELYTVDYVAERLKLHPKTVLRF